MLFDNLEIGSLVQCFFESSKFWLPLDKGIVGKKMIDIDSGSILLYLGKETDDNNFYIKYNFYINGYFVFITNARLQEKNNVNVKWKQIKV